MNLAAPLEDCALEPSTPTRTKASGSATAVAFHSFVIALDDESNVHKNE